MMFVVAVMIICTTCCSCLPQKRVKVAWDSVSVVLPVGGKCNQF